MTTNNSPEISMMPEEMTHDQLIDAVIVLRQALSDAVTTVSLQNSVKESRDAYVHKLEQKEADLTVQVADLTGALEYARNNAHFAEDALANVVTTTDAMYQTVVLLLDLAPSSAQSWADLAGGVRLVKALAEKSLAAFRATNGLPQAELVSPYDDPDDPNYIPF